MPIHHEIWQYYKGTGKAHAQVLQNLVVKAYPIAPAAPAT